ncbi:MAG: proline racemase family protein [Planctomycetes bacterium]|nr:proline racemase family protein [Planctomycetota bacterium]
MSPSPWYRTIEAHTAGEPLRILVEGVPEPPGSTMLEKRRYVREHLDHVRRLLIHEPRGHRDMYAAWLTEPVSQGADLGVLFLHNEGYSTMCGHAVIALGKVLYETGRVRHADGHVSLDVPAGRVEAFVERDETDHVRRVSFRNVPSFVVEVDATVPVPGLGEVRYDVAFGGAYYAYVNANDLGLRLEPSCVNQLVDAGMRIKRAVMERGFTAHPFEPDLSFLYGTIFVAPPGDPRHHSRNVCIFAEGEVDRSPTGTGVSGRVALHVSRGELALGEEIVIESILGTTMGVRAEECVRFGGDDAVIPRVSGEAFVTGWSEFTLEEGDPLGEGFFLG